MDLTIIAGPLIGAVIGYFTNYLAVKMLFRPRREIKIGSKKSSTTSQRRSRPTSATAISMSMH